MAASENERLVPHLIASGPGLGWGTGASLLLDITRNKSILTLSPPAVYTGVLVRFTWDLPISWVPCSVSTGPQGLQYTSFSHTFALGGRQLLCARPVYRQWYPGLNKALKNATE
jgi:hypothetical protein